MSVNSTSDSGSLAEQISNSSTSTESVVSDERAKFIEELVTYVILLAFFIFGVYYFLTMPEMGLLAGIVIIATVFPVMLRTCFYLGIISKVTSKWLVSHIRSLVGK